MPRGEKFLQHPAQRRLDEHISRHGLYWSALVQLSGSKINVELYRRFIPRDEDFIS